MSAYPKQLRPRQQPLKVLKALRNAKHFEKVRESKRVVFAGDSVSCMVHAKASVAMNREYGCIAAPQSNIADTLKQLNSVKKASIVVVFVGPNQIDGLLASLDEFGKLLARLNALCSLKNMKAFIAIIPKNDGKEVVCVKGKKIVVSGQVRQRQCRREVNCGRVHFLQTTVNAVDYAEGDILHPSDTKIEEFVNELITRGIIR